MLTLGSSACRWKGENNLIKEQSKLASKQASQVFPFYSPGYIFCTVNLFLPFLWRRGAAIICFLPLVNLWAQIRSQCSSAKAAFKNPLHSFYFEKFFSANKPNLDFCPSENKHLSSSYQRIIHTFPSLILIEGLSQQRFGWIPSQACAQLTPSSWVIYDTRETNFQDGPLVGSSLFSLPPTAYDFLFTHKFSVPIFQKEG
jgi:hypothetical protein